MKAAKTSVGRAVDQPDAALRFYTEVLGCTVRTDVEAMPGARYVEVVPPGSDVGIVLLPPGSPPPQGHSPVGMQTSPTGTHFTGATAQSPQHTGTTHPGMGHQSGPVPVYHEMPAQRGDGELRELA